uniref:C2H2-type domain-containing protein n=1 Tax=Wuchereria bancrofti TaxID=6293 RepID=A0AAF5Q7Z5_WUCBA
MHFLFNIISQNKMIKCYLIIMSFSGAQIPEHPDISDVLDYLQREPVMLRALQEYMREKEQVENLLLTRLEEAERRLEVEGRSGEEPAPQEPAFNVEEAEWAPLPETDDEAENWPSGAEWAPLLDDDSDEPEVPAAPMETSADAEPVESFRELVLRTRTIRIPVLATHASLVAAAPEEFHPADLGDLPEQLRRELLVPQAEPYTVVQTNEDSNIVCGICGRQFATLKGWRIHASRMHKQDGKFLRPLRSLRPAATRIHGRTKNSGSGNTHSRLVPESVCGRDQ